MCENDYLNYSSYFIPNKALFGSYPIQSQVDDLISLGVLYFLDLTVPGEVSYMYNTQKSKYYNFPIIDRKTPIDNISFTALILYVHNIINNLKKNEKIYIHCKGGHGRVGIIVAILLYLYFGNISSARSIELNYSIS